MSMRKTAAERQAEIILTALRLAHERGPERVSADAIAKLIGVSQPAVFRHFPTKQALWMAIAEWIGEALERIWQRAVSGDAPALLRLRELLRQHLMFIEATPAIPAILFSRELHSQNGALRAFFVSRVQRLGQLLGGLLQEAAREGAIPPRTDTAVAARMLLSLVPGVMLRWSLQGREFDLVAEGMALLELALQGLAPTEAAGR
ncbi:MAG TPA: TetR/AcrR family transcriptional regulator [Candidatus Competibacteraceae bacterium]|nr:TetR/AcrR family transcriptional regulator [Candidatus Competibacteraceae bacterium]